MSMKLSLVAERLEERGYRVTPARQAVLEFVLARSEPFTAEELVRQLREVGRATVFRTFKLLLDMDMLCRIVREDGSVFYQLSGRGHHHHLVCVSCGRVQDFTDCAVPQIVSELARRTNYTIEGHRLEIYGRCAACQTPAHAGG